MTYLQKLENWYQVELSAGRVVDVKFFPGDDSMSEVWAKAVYETLTGVIKTRPLDISKL